MGTEKGPFPENLYLTTINYDRKGLNGWFSIHCGENFVNYKLIAQETKQNKTKQNKTKQKKQQKQKQKTCSGIWKKKKKKKKR